ncbi:MAG: hydrogenase maturation nickel metallochaperone HypA [Desulfobacterales bacterium]|nr:hydrogenase maturation nickel metallochaperone HypA [Desulfobacterales bacterium]
MHEMGIALEILDIIKDSIPKGVENNSVKKINLKIGKLSAIVPKSLTFCFDIAKGDTLLKKAEITIEEVPVKASCNICKKEWTIETANFNCPHCKSGSVEIISGRELEIVSIELDD